MAAFADLPGEGPLAIVLGTVGGYSAPADIVRGDHDLNDTQWQLVAVVPFGEAPGYLRNTAAKTKVGA